MDQPAILHFLQSGKLKEETLVSRTVWSSAVPVSVRKAGMGSESRLLSFLVMHAQSSFIWLTVSLLDDFLLKNTSGEKYFSLCL